jgi:hypothetical protein
MASARDSFLATKVLVEHFGRCMVVAEATNEIEALSAVKESFADSHFCGSPVDGNLQHDCASAQKQNLILLCFGR